MSVDLRGFRYEADAILQQRRWQLDAAVAQLGRLQEQLAVVRASLGELQDGLAAHCATCADARAAGIDPESHVRSLRWLALLQGRIGAVAARLEAIRLERDAAVERLRELQCQVDALDAHRDEAQAEFAIGQLAREAAEADRDWLARSPHAARNAADQPVRVTP